MPKRLMMALIRRLAWVACFFLPIQKNKVVVQSFDGQGYCGNPKYIVEELLAIYSQCEIIWLVRDGINLLGFPDKVKTIRKNSVRAIYHLTTAKVWINNCRGSYRYKKKTQYYIQTWHGFALKRIEKDAENKLDAGYVQAAKRDSQMIDLILSEADFMTELYRKSFWYDREVVQWGSPRNDILINGAKEKTLKQKVADYFKQSEKTKFVLYAPTFRENLTLEPYALDYDRVAHTCSQKFGGEFKILVRLHPNILNKRHELNLDSESVLDASLYADVQELLVAADVVISDYSSLMFDFALSRKPCFQFAVDIDTYKQDRNFYFELERLPFSVSEDNNMLEKNILSFLSEEYKSKLEKFFDDVGYVKTASASLNCAQRVKAVCAGEICF